MASSSDQQEVSFVLGEEQKTVALPIASTMLGLRHQAQFPALERGFVFWDQMTMPQMIEVMSDWNCRRDALSESSKVARSIL